MTYATLALILAGEMLVGWPAVPQSNVAGYRVYYQAESVGVGSPSVWVPSSSCEAPEETPCAAPPGPVTLCQVALEVDDCTEIHVGIKACTSENPLDCSAGWSPLIKAWARPTVLDLVYSQAGMTTVIGDNFKAGATLEIDGVPVPSSQTVVSPTCDQIAISPPVPGFDVKVIQTGEVDENGCAPFGVYAASILAPSEVRRLDTSLVN